MKKIIMLGCIFFLNVPFAYAEAFSIDEIAQIEMLTGAKGDLSAKSGVLKVSIPLTNLHVTAAGIQLNPASGLAPWASFMKMGSSVEVMGDMVVLENQVNPVMKTVFDNGLRVTALHNHFFWDYPKLMFMHIEGEGAIKDVSRAIGKVFQEVKSSKDKKLPPFPILVPTRSTLNFHKIEAILGKKGISKDGVYKVVWDKATTMHGHDLGADMGSFIVALFIGSDTKAVMIGDIAMEEDEVEHVLKTLLKHNIFIVSLHNHMMGESPKLFFVHYMGWGSTTELATALKETLGQIKFNHTSTVPSKE